MITFTYHKREGQEIPNWPQSKTEPAKVYTEIKTGKRVKKKKTTMSFFANPGLYGCAFLK